MTAKQKSLGAAVALNTKEEIGIGSAAVQRKQSIIAERSGNVGTVPPKMRDPGLKAIVHGLWKIRLTDRRGCLLADMVGWLLI